MNDTWGVESNGAYNDTLGSCMLVFVFYAGICCFLVVVGLYLWKHFQLEAYAFLGCRNEEYVFLGRISNDSRADAGEEPGNAY